MNFVIKLYSLFLILKLSTLSEVTDPHSTITDSSINHPLVDYSEKHWPLQCKNGMRQSPIDLSKNSSFYKSYYSDIISDYHIYINSTNYKSISGVHFSNHVNTTFSANVTSLGGYIMIVKSNVSYKYDLNEMNFHYHSEHTIDGNSFDLELQLIHTKNEEYLNEHNVTDNSDEKNNKLIISILFKEDPLTLNLNVAKMNIAKLSNMNGVDLNFYTLPTRNYYHYEGSLTLPDCEENVNWIVMDKIEYLSDKQFSDFKNWIGAIYSTGNNRMVKNLNGRTIHHTISYYPENYSIHLKFSLFILILISIIILIL